MKKTNKFLFLVLILMLAVSVIFGLTNKNVYAAEDEDGYVDLNNVEEDTKDDEEAKKKEEEAKKEETNTTSNNTTGNVTTINKTNTTNTANTANNATNNTTNPTNQATTNHPQAGEFVNAKVIACVSVATIALAFAFVKFKKYNY